MASFNFKQNVTVHLTVLLIQTFRLFHIQCNLCISSFTGRSAEMGYAEGCLMIKVFYGSVTIVCNCMIKRLWSQDAAVMGMFEKCGHSHNVLVLVLHVSHFQMILYIALLT